MTLNQQNIATETIDRPSILQSGRRMVAGLLVLVVFMAIGGFAWTSLIRPGPMSEGTWSLIFVDDFEGGTIDEGRWTICYWWDDSGCTNKGNSELQWYRPENISVGDGLLRLEARQENARTEKGTYRFTSGMVTSGRYYQERDKPDRFNFTYGYLEVRARIPAGRGLWPAIWLLPEDHTSTPEIDVMEALGHAPDQLEMHYHYLLLGEKKSAGQSVRTADLSTDFRRYGVEWNETEIKWYLDGKEMWRVSSGVPIPSVPMYILINLAVGGDWGGPDVDIDRLQAELLVDYVKVWQRGER